MHVHRSTCVLHPSYIRSCKAEPEKALQDPGSLPPCANLGAIGEILRCYIHTALASGLEAAASNQLHVTASLNKRRASIRELIPLRKLMIIGGVKILGAT